MAANVIHHTVQLQKKIISIMILNRGEILILNQRLTNATHSPTITYMIIIIIN